MAKALSRKQKQIANEMQKKMLQPIISYNKLEKLVGSELADNISLVDLLFGSGGISHLEPGRNSQS